MSRILAALALVAAGVASWWIFWRPRPIAVCVYTDSAFRARPDWEGKLRARFDAVNKIYQPLGVRWKLVDMSGQDPNESASLDRRRALLAKRSDCAADELLIVTGATSESRTASVSPFSHAAVIGDDAKLPEFRNDLVMAHELAHLFGVSHDPGQGTLMADHPLSGAVPSRTALLIHSLRKYDFAEGVRALDGPAGDRAFAALKQELTGLAPHPEVQAHLVLAAALHADGVSGPAIPHLKAALAADPKNSAARFDLALCLEQNEQEQDAVPVLREGVKLDPKNARLHAALGAAVLKHNREEAIDEFLQSLRLDPSNPALYATLGDVLANGMGQIDSAILAYKDALKIEPRLVQARAGLDKATAFKAQALNEARLMQREAASHPGDPGAAYSLGIAEARAGNFTDAVKALERATKLEPRFGKAHSTLATLYYLGGNYGAAWSEVRSARAARTDPDPAFLEALTRKMPDAQR